MLCSQFYPVLCAITHVGDSVDREVAQTGYSFSSNGPKAENAVSDTPACCLCCFGLTPQSWISNYTCDDPHYNRRHVSRADKANETATTAIAVS